MLIVNINWRPVRLSLERMEKGEYRISRDGELKGKVRFTREGWKAWCSSPFDLRTFPSFRTACLYVSRYDGFFHDPEIQDYGLRHLRRVNVRGLWFTVATDPEGIQHSKIFLDFPEGLSEPSERMQAILRRALNALAKP